MTRQEFYTAVATGEITSEVREYAAKEAEKYEAKQAERDALNASVISGIRAMKTDRPMSAGEYTSELKKNGVETSITRVTMALKCIVANGEAEMTPIKVNGRWTNGYKLV